MAYFTRHTARVKPAKHSETSREQRSNLRPPPRRSNRPTEQMVYGRPPTDRGSGSVPQFDPYRDEWGHQLEED
jgi:hypothetical protein